TMQNSRGVRGEIAEVRVLCLRGERIGNYAVIAYSTTASAVFIPPTVVVGRVAHRERSERCDGWGLVPQVRYFAHSHALPHPALRATLPTKVGGIRRSARNDGAKWDR